MKESAATKAARLLSSMANPKNMVRGDSKHYAWLASLRKNPGGKKKGANLP